MGYKIIISKYWGRDKVYNTSNYILIVSRPQEELPNIKDMFYVWCKRSNSRGSQLNCRSFRSEIHKYYWRDDSHSYLPCNRDHEGLRHV